MSPLAAFRVLRTTHLLITDLPREILTHRSIQKFPRNFSILIKLRRSPCSPPGIEFFNANYSKRSRKTGKVEQTQLPLNLVVSLRYLIANFPRVDTKFYS